jgi:hypothetical protein
VNVAIGLLDIRLHQTRLRGLAYPTPAIGAATDRTGPPATPMIPATCSPRQSDDPRACAQAAAPKAKPPTTNQGNPKEQVPAAHAAHRRPDGNGAGLHQDSLTDEQQPVPGQQDGSAPTAAGQHSSGRDVPATRDHRPARGTSRRAHNFGTAASFRKHLRTATGHRPAQLPSHLPPCFGGADTISQPATHVPISGSATRAPSRVHRLLIVRSGRRWPGSPPCGVPIRWRSRTSAHLARPRLCHWNPYADKLACLDQSRLCIRRSSSHLIEITLRQPAQCRAAVV